MLKQVSLQKGVEPLQIPYPKDYKGEKSGKPSDGEFHLSSQPRFLTEGEINLADKFIKKLPYRQALNLTGCVMVGNDPLFTKSHNELDEIERNIGLPNTRYASSGGQRQVTERVLILREHGYEGSGITKLLTN
jgi:hypothetical protein